MVFAQRSRLSIAGALWLALSLAVSPAVGQRNTPPVTEEERDRLAEELDKEAAEFARRGNLLKKAARLAAPSVVHIDTQKSQARTTTSGAGKVVEEAGGGVLISHQDKFYVLTNRHVVSDAALANIKIRLFDGRKLKAQRILSDSPTDVAVVAVSPPASHEQLPLLPARLGDSEKMEMGDFVLAVGSPFGLSHSVTYGIISAAGRRDLQLGDGGIRYQNFFQTDCAINPGNSGGPLVNMRGEVIGLNTAIASASGHNEGIGFSIPINMAMFVARQLIETGKVTRAYLGVSLDAGFEPEDALKSGVPRPFGARVTKITARSPAESARLQVGDIIVKYNDSEVADDNHLVNMVSFTPVGTEVELIIYREGKPYRATVKVATRSRFETQ